MWWERHKIQKQVDVGWSPGPASHLLCPLGNRHFTPWGLGTGRVTHLAVREDERQYVSSAGTVPGTAWAPKERTVDTGSVTGGPWKSHSLSPWLLPLPLPYPQTADHGRAVSAAPHYPPASFQFMCVAPAHPVPHTLSGAC